MRSRLRTKSTDNKNTAYFRLFRTWAKGKKTAVAKHNRRVLNKLKNPLSNLALLGELSLD